MINSEYIYNFEEYGRQPSGTNYFFISIGEKQIIKVVQYTYVGLKENKHTYNLGFGTYFPDKNIIHDEEISSNGDHYKVFNTVLSTIPDFFQHYPQAMLMVQGSDSSIEYPKKCRPTCRKKCVPPNCKNAHRRINIYKSFVNTNLEYLSSQYEFWGGKQVDNNYMIIEQYQVINNYDSVFLIKT